ncbi:AraC family transcriptional regulator [Paenibacillus oryzisoli]|uniref:helix-turn-helix transcriptional regulator n=1 Tax=Paenibacillus oryzisoli TaxID=1850517 RepID=UPI003D2D0E08
MTIHIESYTDQLHALQKCIMQPIVFNDISFVLLDALPAYHEPDWTCEEHRHPWFEFNYVMKGSTITTLSGVPFRITAGQSYLIPPGQIHGHYHETKEVEDGFCLRWQLQLLEVNSSTAATCFGKEWIRCFSQPRPIAVEAEINFPLLKLHQKMSVSTIQATLLHWLSNIYESWRPEQHQTVELKHNVNSLLIQQADLYLEKYFATEFKVHDVANALHVSYRNLSRMYKRETGLTLIEKLNDIRIRQAKRFIKETHLSLREIAMAVGFKNEFYLSKMFRRYALMSPTQFKLQIDPSVTSSLDFERHK